MGQSSPTENDELQTLKATIHLHTKMCSQVLLTTYFQATNASIKNAIPRSPYIVLRQENLAEDSKAISIDKQTS